MKRLVLIHPLLLLALCLLLLAGCSSPKPLAAWQDRVEWYVENEGAGSPTALAAPGDNPTAQQIGYIGEPKGLFSPKRTDVQAVLIDVHQYNDRQWWIFLVGMIEQQGGAVDVGFDKPVLERLTPAAFHRTPAGEYHWVWGERDRDALEQYVQPQIARWRKSHPSREDDDPRYTTFPRPWDRYELTASGHTLTIRETVSGAQWQLDLPRPRREVREGGTIPDHAHAGS